MKKHGRRSVANFYVVEFISSFIHLENLYSALQETYSETLQSNPAKYDQF